MRKLRDPEHLAANKDKILIAGGLRPAPGEAFVGGLWVLEVADRDEAVALVEDDSYHHAEHREYCMLAWGKALDAAVVL